MELLTRHPDQIEALAAGLEPVSLPELDRAQLHDRIESKVIVSQADLPTALERLSKNYLVLEHQGARRQGYGNQYFDSAGLRNYHQHHNQVGRRLKVRYRNYENSDLTYFEVKRSQHGRTTKDRRRSELVGDRLLAPDAAFFFKRTGLRPSALVPSLAVRYDRILLVKRDFTERVTIDTNVTFRRKGIEARLPGLAIVEFKQPRLDRQSPAFEAMGARPQMFSKYCMGIASCDHSVRRNRFKKVFRVLDTLDASPITRMVAA